MKVKHPTKEECLKMLDEYNTPAHVVRHCVAVADTALKIAEALNDKGFDFNITLITSAALLHDIARVEEKHWISGADFALRNGYLQEAKIIRRHMTHSLDPDAAKLKELDLVCLGDRLVLEDRYVGIDKRMDYVIEKARGDKKIEKMIIARKEENKRLIRNIEDIIGVSIDELILNGAGSEADEY